MMLYRCRFILLLVLLTAAGCFRASGSADPRQEESPQNLKLWHQRPAQKCDAGLPIGNGHIGAVVLGSVRRERIALNHTRLWREKKLKDRFNPKVAHNLPKIRKLFFDGKIIEATNAANDLLGRQMDDAVLGKWAGSGPDPYQPAGDLFVNLPGHEQVSNYRRELDLTTGIARISYRHNGVGYVREAFVSAADGALVVRLSADTPGSVNCTVELSRIDDPECTVTPWAKGNRIGFVGEFVEKVRFAAAAMVQNKGGRLLPATADTARVNIEQADEVLILLSLATDKETDDSRKHTSAKLDKIARKADFAGLRRAQVAQHGALFNRVSLCLGTNNTNHIPTDERFVRFQAGEPDPALTALLYQYGRYLLITSSRPGGLPANLRGIWNENLSPRWSSDFHHDCNIQMNYWPAEVSNLSECAEPLFDYVESCLPAARIAARNLYDCRGIYIPITNDAAARCLKTEGLWSEWTGGAAWLAQHFWWHWEFTGDKEFLRDRAYPLYKEIALFYQDYLVKDPRPDSPHFGKLVTVPSQSPENGFVGGVWKVSLCIGATMDFELIHEVFTNLLEASEILDSDVDQRDQWRYVLDNIPPLQVGKYGQLQEWLEDYEEADINHRHISHLYGLFPGDQITPEDTPRFARASQVALDRRVSGGKGSGWAGVKAWYAACWARLYNGQRAYGLLQSIFENSDGRSFVISNRRQLVDGIFAFTGAVAEMLLQSHNGQIRILPAIPSAWPTGHVKGLRARGGFDVDIEWNDGRPTEVTIRSMLGNRCAMRSPVPIVVSSGGKSIATREIEMGIHEFDTQPDRVYVISFASDNASSASRGI